MNKVDMVDDEELLELLKWKSESYLAFYDYDGDNARYSRFCLGALNGEAASGKIKSMDLMDAVDSYIPILHVI